MGRTKEGTDQSATQNGPVTYGGEDKEMSVSQRRGPFIRKFSTHPDIYKSRPSFSFLGFLTKI